MSAAHFPLEFVFEVQKLHEIPLPVPFATPDRTQPGVTDPRARLPG